MNRAIDLPTVFLAGSMVLCAAALPAADRKISSKVDPTRLGVEKSLRAEVTGPVDRRAQLAEVLEKHPDSSVARWQAGFICDGSSWRSFDESPSTSSGSEILKDYQTHRRVALRTADSQVQVADWCQRKGLADQERAHLFAALELASDAQKPPLLSRLGYLPMGNRWVSRADLEQWRDFNQRALDSLKRWGPKLEKIAQQLEGSPRAQETGRMHLAQVTDLKAIPAMEYLLCSSEALAGPAIAAFSRMPEYEATIALARQAAFSAWPEVRQEAAAALKTRPFDDFIPGLIACTVAPATATHENALLYLTEGRGGTFVLLHTYLIARETDEQFQVSVLRTADYRISDWLNGQTVHFFREEYGPRDGIGRTRLSLGLAQRQQQLNRDLDVQVEQLMAEENDRTEKLNQRITDVLAAVSGRDRDSNVKTWWQWWENFSDTERPGGKPTAVVNVSENSAGYPGSRFYRMSCFAAGTPVWTDRGIVPIEQIAVGDRVLAKDVETGELSLKPVLKATVRPPRMLTNVRFGDETIVCTGGHRFWNSGSGWIKARDLAPQILVHTVTGNTPVLKADKGETAQTYNLVVADFHTYFVGQAGVLCQDLLPPQRTNNIVPGLPRANAVASVNK
jgi:hypothetical protein